LLALSAVILHSFTVAGVGNFLLALKYLLCATFPSIKTRTVYPVTRTHPRDPLLKRGSAKGNKHMKPITNTIYPAFALFAFACFALPLRAHAVTPAPDGGYFGGNTAEGTSALLSLSSGINNTAVGFQALYHNTTGSNNTAAGLNALFNNIDGNFN